MSCEHYPPNGAFSEIGFRKLQSIGCPLCRIAQLEAELDGIKEGIAYHVIGTATARIATLESALQLIGNELNLHADQGPGGEAFRALLNPTLGFPLEPGSAANATAPGEGPSRPANGTALGTRDGDLACPAALPSSAPETPVRQAHSKSEYKRLTALGVQCIPPETKP